MRHADRPSGPGQPTTRRRDAATEAEELDELGGDASGGNATPAGQDDQSDERHARAAERAAHTKSENDTAASGTTSRSPRRG